MSNWEYIGGDITFPQPLIFPSGTPPTLDGLFRVSSEAGDALVKIRTSELAASELELEMAHACSLTHPNILAPEDLRTISNGRSANSVHQLTYTKKAESVRSLREVLEDEFLREGDPEQLLAELHKRSAASQGSLVARGTAEENLSSIFILPSVERVDKTLYRLWQLLSGLSHLHSRRILHDDIRLSGVVVEGNAVRLLVGGRIKNLSYVNLPKHSEIHYYSELLPELSPGPFRAPERVLNLELKNSSHLFAGDVWALGVLVYQMLCNRLPFGETIGQNATFFASFANKRHQIRKEYIWSLIDALEMPGHPINNLLYRMLSFDPLVRPSVFELLRNSTFDRFIASERPRVMLDPFTTLMQEVGTSGDGVALFGGLRALAPEARTRLIEVFYFKPGAFSPSASSDLALLINLRLQKDSSHRLKATDEHLFAVASFVVAAELTQLQEDLSYARLLVSLLPEKSRSKLFKAKRRLWLAGCDYRIWFVSPCMVLNAMRARKAEQEYQGPSNHLTAFLAENGLLGAELKRREFLLTSLWVVYQYVYAPPHGTLACLRSALEATHLENSASSDLLLSFQRNSAALTALFLRKPLIEAMNTLLDR